LSRPISARLDKPADAERVNDALRHAAAGVLDGILGYTEEELVSADILGRQESGIVHGLSTKCVGNLVKVLVWYDNEAGYAARCLDVADRLL
jgi:glyceraldehyde-3-phosphate dehydrogenase/erythrose-4-phosphate dehydrogenase